MGRTIDITIATTAAEREQCYALRQRVFVGEQNVPVELERDEFDESDAIHYRVEADGRTVATARVRHIGEKAKVQRVSVDKSMRGQRVGHRLMLRIIEDCRAAKSLRKVVLDSQLDAVPFYEQLGFTGQGEVFMDAGIPHIFMTYEFG